MMNAQRTLRTLEQLREMRERAVEDLSSQLAQQKQLTLRYGKNIAALGALSPAAGAPESASQLMNQARYKANIQRVIDWQKQEQALAQIRQQQLQQALVAKACEEKRVALLLQQQQHLMKLARDGQQQKQTDAQAMQCWLRQHREPSETR